MIPVKGEEVNDARPEDSDWSVQLSVELSSGKTIYTSGSSMCGLAVKNIYPLVVEQQFAQQNP